jgi:hypothetical protein
MHRNKGNETKSPGNEDSERKIQKREESPFSARKDNPRTDRGTRKKDRRRFS